MSATKNNIMGSNKINVSFSGGRSSAYMLKILLENYPKDDLIITFANTGKEREETLVFVDQCAKFFNVDIIWLEARFKPYTKGEITKKDCLYFDIVDFNTASRKGEPFADMLKLHPYLPNIYKRFCTQLLKVETIQLYLDSIGVTDYKTALGIRRDEPQRYWRLKKDDSRIFPLWDYHVNSIQVREFWAKQDFDLKLHSYQGNCDLCYLKGVNIKRTILRENPKIAQWWIEQEKTVGATWEKKRSVSKILQESKNTFPLAIDELENHKKNPPLFSCFCGD